MFSQSCLHVRLSGLRAMIRAGTVPAGTPQPLVRTAQIWEQIDRIARDPAPQEDLVSVGALVSECAAGMIRSRQSIGPLLEDLARAPDSDLQRVDRALAGFAGLDSGIYPRACVLALWTEANRVPPGNSFIPRGIAAKIAGALEENAESSADLDGKGDWEPFVFARIPPVERIRVLQLTHSERGGDFLLKSLHPEGIAEAFLTPLQSLDSARAVVRIHDTESLRALMNGFLEGGDIGNQARRFLVPVLVEADRTEEAHAFLGEIPSGQLFEYAALQAVSMCAAREMEHDARAFLARLPPGKMAIKGRVEIVCAALHFSGDVDAAAAEMEEIERGSLSLGEPGFQGGETRPGEPAIPRAAVLALVPGWTSIVFARTRLGQIWEAFAAARRVGDLRRRVGCIRLVLGRAQRNIPAGEAIRLAEAVMRSAADAASREHELYVMRDATSFLARTGTMDALECALNTVRATLADTDAAIRDAHVQSTLAVFVQSPPCEMGWEETAAVGRRLVSPLQRAACLRILALHAAVGGHWKITERLQRRVRRIWRKESARSGAGSRGGDDSAARGDEPSVEDFLRWMRKKEKFVSNDSASGQWFVEAFAMAQAMGAFSEEAVYAVGRLILDSPPFPGRDALYGRVLEDLQTPFKHTSAPFFMGELGRRMEALAWDPAVEPLREMHRTAEENPPSPDAVPTVETVPPAPRALRKQFDEMLAGITRVPGLDDFLSVFLSEVAKSSPFPPPEPLLDALFDAARRIQKAGNKGRFAGGLYALAWERGGDSSGARRVMEAARAFAVESGSLPEYQSEIEWRLPPEAGGNRTEQKIPFEEEVRALDLEPALERVAGEGTALNRMTGATELFEKALLLGERRAFARVFELAEAAFATACSQHDHHFPVEFATRWFSQVGRWPHKVERLQWLRRMGDWVCLLNHPYNQAFVPPWAGQIAAAGEVESAVESVERLASADERAHGFARVAVGSGAARGDVRAMEILHRFEVAAEQAKGENSFLCGVCEGLRVAAMAFAEAGHDAGLHRVIEAGKKLTRTISTPAATRVPTHDMLVALTVARRTDLWEGVLDNVLQTKQMSGWSGVDFLYFLDEIWEVRGLLCSRFTLEHRLAFLEKVFAMVRKADVSLDCVAARVLHISIQGLEDPRPVLERFEALSGCAPKLVGSLLECTVRSTRTHKDPPQPPGEPMLRWIASLCPFAEQAAVQWVEHVAFRSLHRNDWDTLRRLAMACPALDLTWLEKLADALLAEGGGRCREEISARPPEN